MSVQVNQYEESHYTVINDELIKDSIRREEVFKHTDDDDDDHNQIKEDPSLREQNIDFENEVKVLVFSNKSIYRISNLEGFTKLTMLQLDNNNIQKMENLSHLCHLKRLDLSFNRITKIEGLSGLTQLENLSLFDNNISSIENMGDLENLRCFSIAKNNLADKENVVYNLRKNHPKLGMLTVFDNPVCADRQFRSMTLAFLESLQFLDYRLIATNERQSAKDKFNEKIIALMDSEERAKEDEEKLAEDQETVERLKAANLTGVQGLFRQLFAVKPIELEHFAYCCQEAFDTYEEKFSASIVTFSRDMFEKFDAKENERQELNLTMDTEIEHNDSYAKKLIHAFEKKKKDVFLECGTIASDDDGVRMLQDLLLSIESLASDLVAIEVDQSEAFQDILVSYKENFEVMDSREVISTAFKDFKSHEDDYSRSIREIFLAQINNKDNLEDDLKNQVRGLLEDKDQLLSSLSRSSESRVELIQSKEEELLLVEKDFMTNHLAEVRQAEHHRNRSRISEIWTFVDRVREEIQFELSKFVHVLHDDDDDIDDDFDDDL
mmetsp:Transcript_14301/g.21615  ORF Transcript_14301/g.21615 Transcript_14301/m.21615 type:complete len:551 (-) Transcript_14301:30-1682(-)